LHHAIETSPPTKALAIPVFGPILGSFFVSQFPVMVFLMLSGFCLYFPLVRKNPMAPVLSTGFAAFMHRRFMRIGPPYYWTAVFCLAMAAVPALQVGRWVETGPIDFGCIVTHLLFIHNLFPAYSSKIDYPMWSIGLEFQLYLLFPFFVWAFRRYSAALVFGSTLFLAAFCHATHRRLGGLGVFLHRGPFTYLEVFSLGMIAAALTVKRRVLLPKWVLGSVAIAGFAAVRFGSGDGFVHNLATCVATLSILLLAIDEKGIVSRALSAKWLVRLGVFSYSIYLVHAPLLHLFWFALRPLELTPDVEYWVIMALGMPLVVALTYLFHRAFERPYMRLPSAAPAPATALAGTAGARSP
jgi:peptidoglycan/LPS O-acetylase OafA/YrhL